jgi:hypothetical protein
MVLYGLARGRACRLCVCRPADSTLRASRPAAIYELLIIRVFGSGTTFLAELRSPVCRLHVWWFDVCNICTPGPAATHELLISSLRD